HFGKRYPEVHPLDEARLLRLVEGADDHLGDALRQLMAVLVVIDLSGLVGHLADGKCRQIVSWQRGQMGEALAVRRFVAGDGKAVERIDALASENPRCRTPGEQKCRSSAGDC